MLVRETKVTEYKSSYFHSTNYDFFLLWFFFSVKKYFIVYRMCTPVLFKAGFCIARYPQLKSHYIQTRWKCMSNKENKMWIDGWMKRVTEVYLTYGVKKISVRFPFSFLNTLVSFLSVPLLTHFLMIVPLTVFHSSLTNVTFSQNFSI